MLFNNKAEINFPYIDMHSHIIYNIDDGSKSFDESVNMLRTAYDDGIRVIVATPHYHPVKCTSGIDKYQEQFYKLRDTCSQMFPNMKLFLGREIYYTTDVLDAIQDMPELYMNKGSYMLIEYSVSVDYTYIKNSIISTVQEGIIPIIAHVERYSIFTTHKDAVRMIAELKDMGAVIQVNASSVTGANGSSVQKLIKNLLNEEIIDLVATDAHSNGTRSPKMDKTIKYIAKKYGVEYARQISLLNPKAIINNQYI